MEDKIIFLDGRQFRVDTVTQILHRADKIRQTISKEELKDEGEYFSLLISGGSRKAIVPQLQLDSEHKIPVTIPKEIFDQSFWKNDAGISQINKLSRESGWNIFVADQNLSNRLSGRLNTIDIAGHTFYVDLPMDMLRPKDDFISNGIPFGKIQSYLSDEGESYRITYDPVKHEFQSVDLANITAIPDNLVVIEFSPQWVLDPVGYARQQLTSPLDFLGESPFKANFTAKIIPWEKTAMHEIIRKNIARNKLNTKKSKKIKRGKGI